MNEPITLAKVRKETKITVPSGGWVVLVSPNETNIQDHIDARRQLLGNVNDDYEKVIIGRLRNSHTDLRFLTTEQKKTLDKDLAKASASFSKSGEEAAKRESDMEKAEKEKADVAHKTKVAEANKINDSIRNQNKTSKEIKKEKSENEQTETETEKS